ncbi:MAG: tetratricopeptide repeat protein [Bacteroidaceae bacterium]|nr:tetratricopeptide repeat protein [Bacteroidaceae bacterium]
MDIKAFQNIYSEAEDAFAERRFFDALSLTEAIAKDLPQPDDFQSLDKSKSLHDNYCAVLTTMMATPDAHEALLSKSEALFQQAFQLLQAIRHRWACVHPELSTYARTASLYTGITVDDIVVQLQTLSQRHEGEQAYYQQLDTVFNLLWCHQPESLAYATALRPTLLQQDSFTRRTLVGALLLSVLECFIPSQLQLLIALGKPQEGDTEFEHDNLMARVAVALSIICQRYTDILGLYPEETALIRSFFQQEYMKDHMEPLLHAITGQSLCDHIEHRVDDIMPVIREVLEREQPHLGTRDNENENENDNENDNGNDNGNDNVNENENDNENENENGNAPFNIEFKQISLESLQDERLFNKLAKHAREVDRMRQSDLDINKSSFSHMKSFAFFSSTAHWFYPFSLSVTDIKESLTLSNGKPDLLTLSIMKANRFCDSDCYSYACMIQAVRTRAISKLAERMHTALELMDDQLPEFGAVTPAQVVNLNPFTSYCQSVYRYFYDRPQEHIFLPFDPARQRELPTLPIFKGLFTVSSDLDASIDLCYVFGDSRQALSLIEASVERFGINLWLLHEKADVYMQCQQWKLALSAYQQVRIFEDEERNVSLAMARCYEALKQWNDALPLLQSKLTLLLEDFVDESPDPETLNLIEETGRCLIQLRRWDEAVQHFFRLELLGRHLNVARRAIAWCSLHQGKFERACSYYDQLIQQGHASWEDHLNRGHALWLQGRTSEAITAYRKAQATFDHAPLAKRQHFSHWTEAFREDARSLLAQHFTTIDCALMLDAVAMTA